MGDASNDPLTIISGGSGGIEEYAGLPSIAVASNIIIGDNPPYALTDFLAAYPQFDSVSGVSPPDYPVPAAMMQLYISIASASLQYDRWNEWWMIGMHLYVAHFCTLYLQSKTNAGDAQAKIVSAASAKAVLVSKSVGDVSGGYRDIVSGWESWGAFNLTVFGQQLITFADLVGRGGMYVY